MTENCSEQYESSEVKQLQSEMEKRVQERSPWRCVPGNKGDKNNLGWVNSLKKGTAVKSVCTFIMRMQRLEKRWRELTFEKEVRSQTEETSIPSCPHRASGYMWHQKKNNPHKVTLQFTPMSYNMNIFVSYIGFKIFLKCIAYISSFLKYGMINLNFFGWLKKSNINVND